METIYVIIAFSNDYDMGPWNVGWTETKEEAIEKIKHLNKLHEKADSYQQKIDNFVESIKNIVPIEEHEQLPPYPQLPSGFTRKNMTHEMKEERKIFKKLKLEICNRNQLKYDKYWEEIDRRTQEYTNSLNINPEIMKHEDCIKSYNYQELKNYKP